MYVTILETHAKEKLEELKASGLADDEVQMCLFFALNFKFAFYIIFLVLGRNSSP